MIGMRTSGALLVAALNGCGGDAVSDPCAAQGQLLPGEVAFAQSTPQETTQSWLAAYGNGFVPANSACEVVVRQSDPSDPFSPPIGWACQCTTRAPVCVTWKNEMSGAAGRGSYEVRSGTQLVSGVPIEVCAPAYTRWTADIPLVTGTNGLVVTMSDGQSSGVAAMSVTRN